MLSHRVHFQKTFAQPFGCSNSPAERSLVGISRSLQAQVFWVGLQVGPIQAIQITKNYFMYLN